MRLGQAFGHQTILHMLCEKCQQREATCHMTFASGNIDEVPTTADLCGECFEASSPLAREALAELRAGCCYCGGEPYCSCIDLSVALHRGPKTRVLCNPCSKEFYRVMRLKVPGMGRGIITPEQAANLPTIFAELHEHMKKWVSERGA